LSGGGELLLRVGLVAFTLHFLPRVFHGDIPHFWTLAGKISAHRLPYRDVPLEFPPFTVAFLVLRKIPSLTYFQYRWLFALVMVGFEYGSLTVLRKAWPELAPRITAAWYLTVVPVSLLAWFRFDLAAVFFATLALVSLEKDRPHGGWATVVGFGLKLWPAVLIPSFLLRGRRRVGVVAAAGCGALLAAWVAFSPRGFRQFLKFREGAGLEVESLPASVRLFGHHGRFMVRSGAWVIDVGGFGWVNTVLTAVLVVFAVGLVVLAARHPRPDLVALAAALTLASFLFSRIISAQYMVWLGPFVALLWGRGHRAVGWLGAAVSVSTVGYLCGFKSGLLQGNHVVAALVLVRNVLLVAMLAELSRLTLSGRARRAAEHEVVAAPGITPERKFAARIDGQWSTSS